MLGQKGDSPRRGVLSELFSEVVDGFEAVGGEVVPIGPAVGGGEVLDAGGDLVDGASEVIGEEGAVGGDGCLVGAVSGEEGLAWFEEATFE